MSNENESHILQDKKILIVDDHSIVREGLKRILEQSEDINVIAEARDSQEAIRLIQHNTFDIIILDISLPGKNGLELLSDIKNIIPEQKRTFIIYLSFVK